MTTILSISAALPILKANAEVEYEEAKRHVTKVMADYNPFDEEHQAQFRAAMRRQAEARDRYMRALRA